MPIRPEKPEDFEIGNPFGTAKRLFKEYMIPGLAKMALEESRLSRRLAVQAFGHPWNEIKPEFWIWRRLADVPRESDGCPWV